MRAKYRESNLAAVAMADTIRDSLGIHRQTEREGWEAGDMRGRSS